MLDPIQHLPDGAKSVIDAGAFLAFVAHLVGLTLPPILSLLTIIWLAIRIWESETAQNLVARFRRKGD